MFLLITALTLACFPAIPGAETHCSENIAPKGQSLLQPGTLPAAGHAMTKPSDTPWMPSDTSSASRKRWIRVGSGSLPIADAIQPGATQKYGTDPAVLQVYFGHRP
jgi:hypothetical protein